MSLPNREHDAIMAEYEDLRRFHKGQLDEKLRRIYEEHPSILENRIAQNENAAERARAAVRKDEALLSRLNDEKEALSAARRELLSDAGLTEEDFLPVFSCPLCRDTGYTDGKKCRCFRRREREILYRDSHLESVLEEENFDTLRTDLYDRTSVDGSPSRYERMLEVIEICHSYVENFDYEHKNLLFYGQTGVGKTFLSNCIAKALLDSGHSVLYFSAISLFDLFSELFSRSGDRSPENPLLNLYEADLVIIDDLGTELKNSFTTGQLFHLINERLLAKKSTIISTNLTLNELGDQYTERTASRILSCYDPILLTGDDLRIKIRLESGRS